MGYFVTGFVAGIALSILYYVALNLFKDYPHFSSMLDLKDHLSDINKRLDDVISKVSHRKI